MESTWIPLNKGSKIDFKIKGCPVLGQLKKNYNKIRTSYVSFKRYSHTLLRRGCLWNYNAVLFFSPPCSIYRDSACGQLPIKKKQEKLQRPHNICFLSPYFLLFTTPAYSGCFFKGANHSLLFANRRHSMHERWTKDGLNPIERHQRNRATGYA